jgi:hypothetical protein
VSGFGKGATDFVVGIFVVAAIYLLVRPESKAVYAVVNGSEAVKNLILLVTGPYPA